MVVDPEKARRRARVLRPLGILVTIVGAGLLLVGVGIIAINPLQGFDVFWMPFVGGFMLFPGILMWVAGNLAKASADYASTNRPMFGAGSPPHAFQTAGTRTCPSCGNSNPIGTTTCSVCGTRLG
jgi:hypothetical protein